MSRLLVNDALSQLGERTFWHELRDWFGLTFVGGDYATLADEAGKRTGDATLLVRNASYFGPIKAACPQIALWQDLLDGSAKETQIAVAQSCKAVVWNSEFAREKCADLDISDRNDYFRVIPLPVDFATFEPGNAMGLQQALALPDGCVCWIGASRGAAGHVKGFDIFTAVVRANPDIHFVGVFKDAAPEYHAPNLRCYARLPQDELARVIGACRVGLCTSRTETQHLAGIEMGACGLPMVAPAVGVYWQADRFGVSVVEPNVAAYTGAIREWLAGSRSAVAVRESWRADFDKPVVRAQWQRLIDEVEAG